MSFLFRPSNQSYPFLILTGWGVFSGTHLFLSHPPIRKKVIRSFCNGSEPTFLGIYSILGLACFIPTTLLYVRYRRSLSSGAHTENSLWNPTRRQQVLGNLLKLSGLYSLFESISTPSPITTKAPPSPHDGLEKMPESTATPHGIHRITRHPTFFSLALLALGQLCTRRSPIDLAYWAPYPIFWVIGSIHQDYRLKSESHPITGKPRFSKEYLDQTSLLPFGAVLKGKQDIREIFREINVKHLVMASFSWLWWL